MVHHGLGVSVVPLRTGDSQLSLAVRTVPFSGAPVDRVVGLVRAADHPKAALSDALLGELKALVPLARLPVPPRPARTGAPNPKRN
jgi:hypothetical protein